VPQRRIAYCLACLLIAVCPSAAAQPSDPIRSITPLRGNLYRAQDGPRVTVFRVDPDGIALVDPMSLPFARYLREQFAARFPDRPVKYVIYSGLDLERTGGAGVFDATAEVIAHEHFNQRSNAARERSPELSKSVMFAESQFATRRTLYGGDAPIDLIYPGPAAGIGQTLVYFRNEHVLFAATHPSLAAPFGDRNIGAASVAQWTGTVAELEFDLLLDGRGETATRPEAMAADGYVQAVIAGMEDASVRSLSVEQLQRSTAIDRFEGTPFARVRDADIAALHRRTTILMLDAFGGALVNRIPTEFQVCEGGRCQISPATGPGWVVGTGFTLARLRVLAELSNGAPVDVVGSGLTVRSRERHVSVLGGFRTKPVGRFAVAVLGGFTHVTNSFKARQIFGPSFDSSEGALRLTYGADVWTRLTNDVALVVPLRFTPGVDFVGETQVGLGVRAGVGVSFTYRRQAM
jgi:hypothetical protein